MLKLVKDDPVHGEVFTQAYDSAAKRLEQKYSALAKFTENVKSDIANSSGYEIFKKGLGLTIEMTVPVVGAGLLGKTTGVLKGSVGHAVTRLSQTKFAKLFQKIGKFRQAAKGMIRNFFKKCRNTRVARSVKNFLYPKKAPVAVAEVAGAEGGVLAMEASGDVARGRSVSSSVKGATKVSGNIAKIPADVRGRMWVAEATREEAVKSFGKTAAHLRWQRLQKVFLLQQEERR